MPKAYSDKLDPEDQLFCEEAVHTILFEGIEEEGLHEEALMTLAKRCTQEVLRRFRPDLFER